MSRLPAVLIDENVQRLRGVLERLSDESIDARGFADPRAALRHVRDHGTTLLVVSATTREVTAAEIARAARTARDGEPLTIALAGAACPEGGPFDEAVPTRAADEVVALCTRILGITAAPALEEAEESKEEEEAPVVAAPPLRPRDPQPPLRELPSAQRYVPTPVAAAPPSPPGPPEPQAPHVVRPTPMADIFARYRVR